jgi:hypothetical protein
MFGILFSPSLVQADPDCGSLQRTPCLQCMYLVYQGLLTDCANVRDTTLTDICGPICTYDITGIACSTCNAAASTEYNSCVEAADIIILTAVQGCPPE